MGQGAANRGTRPAKPRAEAFEHAGLQASPWRPERSHRAQPGKACRAEVGVTAMWGGGGGGGGGGGAPGGGGGALRSGQEAGWAKASQNAAARGISPRLSHRPFRRRLQGRPRGPDVAGGAGRSSSQPQPPPCSLAGESGPRRCCGAADHTRCRRCLPWRSPWPRAGPCASIAVTKTWQGMAQRGRRRALPLVLGWRCPARCRWPRGAAARCGLRSGPEGLAKDGVPAQRKNAPAPRSRPRWLTPGPLPRAR